MILKLCKMPTGNSECGGETALDWYLVTAL